MTKDKLLPCVVCGITKTYRRVDGRPVCTKDFFKDAAANGGKPKDYSRYKIPRRGEDGKYI